MKPKEPKEDPELKRQRQASQIEKINSIQDRLSTETDSALRYFGARRALSGARGSPLMG
ncbi:hypothetical protein MRS76_11260 [Rhizobiaceae bacterium n13]|uniref:hypothetical protein n=1 Tax=Ferirhizobium litorale TaxID=2927786 RepID=UPI0024B2D958|nr:hypothetical protein [Fererhizobium litorale]MDI7862539.1 hypothetical protein [Fererhizobium litorale]